MLTAAFLSFSTGFLSLSLEILWIRLFSFINHSLPQAFAFVLIFYLIGIAAGAHIGKRLCDNPARNLWQASGIVLIISSIMDISSPWLYALVAPNRFQLIFGAILIFITALMKAIIFPIAHHLGTLQIIKNLGRSISRVYVANILGATLGPLFTGVVLLALFTTQQSFIICGVLTFSLALYCLNKLVRRVTLALSVLNGIVLALGLFMLNGHLLIKIIAERENNVRRIIETPNGIIVTYFGGTGGDYITGGNVYDGRTNLDPVINSNSIDRVLVLAALHDQPKRVLIIGLSIGTWLKLITAFPGVENIDTIEINPGYLTAINDYPRQKSALLDPRVHLYIDDGRRWLKAHPANRYDLIIMNTTYYWRAYSTNLLSQEFLRILKQRMNPGAVLAYNSTGSPDALKTAPTVFRYPYLYQNFIIASDVDWRLKMRQPAAIKKLASLQLDGKLLYPAGSTELIKNALRTPLLSVDAIEPFFLVYGRTLEVITDNNVITEFKNGQRLI